MNDPRGIPFSVAPITHFWLATATRRSQALDIFERMYQDENGHNIDRQTASDMFAAWLGDYDLPWSRAKGADKPPEWPPGFIDRMKADRCAREQVTE